MDWYRITKEKEDLMVEWSSRGDQNLRASSQGRAWLYSHCPQAKNALHMGVKLVAQNYGEIKEVKI